MLALIPIKFLNLDFSITNFLWVKTICVILIVLIIFTNSTFKLISFKENLFFFLPNNWQKSLIMLSELNAQLVNDIIITCKNNYLSLISVLFNFILFSNLIGLIPYSFTTTSHFILTFILSFSVFAGINIAVIKKYKIKTFSLFLPSNTSIFLAPLLIPIELISYIAKPISLGVRIFINLMAGHSLLKVIIGFSWSMLLLENIMALGHVFPIITLIILFALETGVAIIQTYVL